MAYGTQTTDEVAAPQIGGNIMIGGATDAGQQIAEQELQQSMGMTQEQIAQEKANIDYIVGQGALNNQVASEILDQIPPHLHGLAQERIEAVMQQAGRVPNETAQQRDQRVAEENAQIQQAAGAVFAIGAGGVFAGLLAKDPDMQKSLAEAKGQMNPPPQDMPTLTAALENSTRQLGSLPAVQASINRGLDEGYARHFV